MVGSTLGNMTEQAANSTSKRIEYIDALRGFTMILVVVQHVASFYFDVTVESVSVHHYLQQIRMPLFFFISGFVFFKNDEYWNIGNATRFIKKKFIVQIISPTLFMLLYVIYRDAAIEDALFSRYKYSYWFTYTLFQYFIFYLIAQQVIGIFKMKSPASDGIQLLFTLFVCLLSTDAVYNRLPWNSNVNELLGTATWRHFIFFIAGVFARRYFRTVEKILDKTAIVPLCIVVYIVMNMFDNRSDTLTRILFYVTVGMCGVITVFATFRRYRKTVSGRNRFGQIMQFIGRRTLDIYLIHGFFMITPILGFIPDVSGINSIAEFFLSFIISLIIVAASLGVSSIIRLSPTAARFLFGAK